ncbi:MAG: TerB family tellurite resistance protein [Bacteroidota bacterium]
MSAASFETFDLRPLPESQRLAFYGALFAIADADHNVDDAESTLIFETLDLEPLSADARTRVFQLAIEPPRLGTCLEQLRGANTEVRHSLMLNLIDIALADESIDFDEHVGLRDAQELLGIDPDDIQVMHDLAYHAQHDGDGVNGPVARRPLRFKSRD